VVNLDELGVDPAVVGPDASKVVLEQLYIPEVESSAEFIEGVAEEKAEKLASILVKGGLV
ncbi:MAG: electron transfer flavoprotein subunit beta/FixA family protein, partial [Dethiobacteria bacterium]